jgi:hypothetical protein
MAGAEDLPLGPLLSLWEEEAQTMQSTKRLSQPRIASSAAKLGFTRIYSLRRPRTSPLFGDPRSRRKRHGPWMTYHPHVVTSIAWKRKGGQAMSPPLLRTNHPCHRRAKATSRCKRPPRSTSASPHHHGRPEASLSQGGWRHTVLPPRHLGRLARTEEHDTRAQKIGPQGKEKP